MSSRLRRPPPCRPMVRGRHPDRPSYPCALRGACRDPTLMNALAAQPGTGRVTGVQARPRPFLARRPQSRTVGHRALVWDLPRRRSERFRRSSRLSHICPLAFFPAWTGQGECARCVHSGPDVRRHAIPASSVPHRHRGGRACSPRPRVPPEGGIKTSLISIGAEIERLCNKPRVYRQKVSVADRSRQTSCGILGGDGGARAYGRGVRRPRQ